jgi:hypothetical protein
MGHTPQTEKENMMPRPLPQHVRFIKDGTGRPCVAIEYEDYLDGYRYAVVVLSEKDTATRMGAHRRLRSRMQASRQQKDGKLFVAFKPWNGKWSSVNMVMVLVKAASLLRIGWTADKAGFRTRLNRLATVVRAPKYEHERQADASVSKAEGGQLAPNQEGPE